MGKDRQYLLETIESIFHADWLNTNVRLPFMLLNLMFCLHLTLVSQMPTQ